MTSRTGRFFWRSTGALYLFLLLPALSVGQETTLTLDQALETARTRAPILLAARARIEEARGRLKGASVLFQQNRSIETEAGPRFSTPNTFTKVDVALTQDVERGGR